MGNRVFRILDPMQKIAATGSISPAHPQGIHLDTTVLITVVDRLK
jgi:hypothetical protein